MLTNSLFSDVLIAHHEFRDLLFIIDLTLLVILKQAVSWATGLCQLCFSLKGRYFVVWKVTEPRKISKRLYTPILVEIWAEIEFIDLEVTPFEKTTSVLAKDILIFKFIEYLTRDTIDTLGW